MTSPKYKLINKYYYTQYCLNCDRNGQTYIYYENNHPDKENTAKMYESHCVKCDSLMYVKFEVEVEKHPIRNHKLSYDLIFPGDV